MGTAIATAVRRNALFVPDLGPRKREAVLQHLVSRAAAAGFVREPDAVREALGMRERLGIPARGKGVAVCEVRSLGVAEAALVVGRSARGVEWNASDGQPVHLVLLLLSPAELSLDTHLDGLARLAAATRLARNRARILEADDVDAVLAAIRQAAP